MSITSFIFVGFLSILFVFLKLCDLLIKDVDKSRMVQNSVILLGSYLFVIYADLQFALILLVLTVATWFCAKYEKYNKIGIIFAIVILGYFKYMNFFLDTIGGIFGQDAIGINLILPIGISFYVFSAIGYIADVARGKYKAENLFSVAIYLAFFPKITSGPIQRANDFFEQLNQKREIGWKSFSVGIQIFMFGLFKKIVLADRLAVFVNQVYDLPLAFDSSTVFLATIAYSIQIYFDFSGYSDMAIGVAKIIGFDLPRNFNLPYLSQNVTELWKRWHITLSNWLQEYLYISLGGNRKSVARTYINLLATMLLGGLWHGANWTFVIWGGLHGCALVVHKVWLKMTNNNKRKNSMFWKAVCVFITFMFTNLCWIFFRAESFNQAMTIIYRIVSFDVGIKQYFAWLFVACFILLSAYVVAYYTSKKNGFCYSQKNACQIEGFYPFLNLENTIGLTVFFVFCGLILSLAHTGGSPFIYGSF